MSMYVVGREEGRKALGDANQFAATMGFPLILSFLDLGLCLTLGMEDLFFFF